MWLRNINWTDWIFAIIGTALAPVGVLMILAEAWLAFAALIVGFIGLRAAVLHWVKLRKSRRSEREV